MSILQKWFVIISTGLTSSFVIAAIGGLEIFVNWSMILWKTGLAMFILPGLPLWAIWMIVDYFRRATGPEGLSAVLFWVAALCSVSPWIALLFTIAAIGGSGH